MNLPPLSMLQPTEVDGYMIVANQLLPAIEALSRIENIPTRGCALLAAHATECALKAIIRHKGQSFTAKEQHNLLALWNTAALANIINIPMEPPDWVQILSIGHGPHFYFRYQQGEKKNFVHGGPIPALIPMAQALRNLIETVSSALSNTSE